MPEVHEYSFRSFSGFYQRSSVVIDFAKQAVVFDNSLLPKGFFNLFFQKRVDCPFADIGRVEGSTVDGTRCLHVDTAHGYCNFTDDMEGFDEFVQHIRAIKAAQGASE